jgi:hypothetical protein
MKYIEGSTVEFISNAEKLIEKSLLHIKDFDSSILLDKSPQEILLILINKQYKYGTVDEFDKIQCDKCRYRSQGDLYRLMKNYYSELTLQQLRQLLIDLINSEEISSFYCMNINKRVYFNINKHDWSLGELGHVTRMDEFGLNITKNV